MSDTGIKAAKQIFDQALELPEASRPAFLESACSGDAPLRRMVEEMVEAFESGNTLLNGPETFLLNPDAIHHMPSAFEGTSRFAIKRKLGSGAFGTVYEAWDRQHHSTIALKVLHSQDPDVLFRFKREFRSLVDVRHPNLIKLYEFFSESERWFYTMELIQGETFLEYVRPDGGGCDIERLRSSLGQLVDAVRFLHKAKRLHRDLKPSNALITEIGRAVVLDFGLVRELDASEVSQSVTHIVGTPAYMAPEQVLEGKTTEASDWYAIGVMLFQALTGKLPHADSVLGRWNQRFSERMLRPSELQSGVPKDLDELCCKLLQLRPEDRQNPDSVAASGHNNGPAGPAEVPPDDSESFIGRARQLTELDCAFAETREGRFSVVLLHGRSGIGKTALVQRFLSKLGQQQPTLIALRGRCHEFESVPYKGLDALIDELCKHLQHFPTSRVEALLPRDASLLPKLFPVLGRVKPIANAPIRSAVVADAQELRQRTFAALRELLGRLSDRQPLVIWIDDLQWGDRDSSTFLAELCAPPLQPPLLLILTYRSEELSSSSTLSYLHQVLSSQRVLGNWRQIELDQLSSDESHALLGRLLPTDTDVSESTQRTIIDEAQGHPLFLQQLLQFASSRVAFTASDVASGELDLRKVLSARVSELPKLARNVLEFVCVASQPLPVSILFEAATTDRDEEGSEALATLIRGKFIRSSAATAERRVEPFHDQVRTAVVEGLSTDRRRDRHARLAHVLEAQPDIEPQILVKHYQEAGDWQAAHRSALKAAAAAENQLAFDRAAVFYDAALQAIRGDSAGPPELCRKLADTLGLAGRGREAAYSYLKAASAEGITNEFELRRLAADQLLRSGYIDEGLQIFDDLARSVGIKIPSTPDKTIRSILWARFRTRVRLIFGIPDASSLTSSKGSMRLELLRTGAIILNSADPVLAAYFQTQYVVEALGKRESVHVAIALAIESSIRLAAGHGNFKRTLRLLARAEEIAAGTHDSGAIGLVRLLTPYNDYLMFNIPKGIIDGQRAIEFLRTKCVGAAWEITSGYVLLFWFMCWSGRTKEVRDQLPQLLKDGATRGDVNLEVSLRLLSYVHYSYLSLGQPDQCIKECEIALAKWSRRGYHLQHYGALFALVECNLYLRDYARARAYILADWEVMSSSFILRWQTLLVMALFLRGRVALACWLNDVSDTVLRREVEHYAKRLKRVRPRCGLAMAAALRAGLAAGASQWDIAATEFEVAAEEFEKSSLHSYASAAKHMRHRVRADARGLELEEEAWSFLREQEVVNPEAFWSMLLPGDWMSRDDTSVTNERR